MPAAVRAAVARLHVLRAGMRMQRALRRWPAPPAGRRDGCARRISSIGTPSGRASMPMHLRGAAVEPDARCVARSWRHIDDVGQLGGELQLRAGLVHRRRQLEGLGVVHHQADDVVGLAVRRPRTPASALARGAAPPLVGEQPVAVRVACRAWPSTRSGPRTACPAARWTARPARSTACRGVGSRPKKRNMCGSQRPSRVRTLRSHRPMRACVCTKSSSAAEAVDLGARARPRRRAAISVSSRRPSPASSCASQCSGTPSWRCRRRRASSPGGGSHAARRGVGEQGLDAGADRVRRVEAGEALEGRIDPGDDAVVVDRRERDRRVARPRAQRAGAVVRPGRHAGARSVGRSPRVRTCVGVRAMNPTESTARPGPSVGRPRLLRPSTQSPIGARMGDGLPARSSSRRLQPLAAPCPIRTP